MEFIDFMLSCRIVELLLYTNSISSWKTGTYCHYFMPKTRQYHFLVKYEYLWIWFWDFRQSLRNFTVLSVISFGDSDVLWISEQICNQSPENHFFNYNIFW